MFLMNIQKNDYLPLLDKIFKYTISLERTPQLCEDLEKSNVTLREACGNSVRNVLSSPLAGIDKLEAFDVSPYA